MKVAEHFPIFMEFFNIVPIGTSIAQIPFFSPQNSFRQSSTTKKLVFILFFAQHYGLPPILLPKVAVME